MKFFHFGSGLDGVYPLIYSRCEESFGKLLEMGLNYVISKKVDPFLDACSENMDLMLIWVKLPGLSVEFWYFEVSKEIRNSPRMFYEVDMSFLSFDNLSITCILVRIDLREGLATDFLL
jgi:hypothetical protein